MGEGEIYMGRFTKPDLDGGGKDLHGEIYQTRFLDGGGEDLSNARARVFRHRAVSWACGSLEQSNVEYCFELVGSLCVGA